MIRGLICTALLACSATAAAQRLVIDDVRLIDTDDGAILANRAVVVEAGRIVSIISAGAPSGDAVVIDGNGGWLIPGLAEMHAHVPSRDRGEQAARDVLSLFLANGVTTIRGMLGEPWHLELRDLLASGAWDGPRLVTSGPSFNGRTVSSPEQGAARVHHQVAAGYDFLKIHPGLSRDEFLAIAKAARAREIPLAGHVSFETGLDTALDAGQATIDHLDGYAQAMLRPDSGLAGLAPQWFGLNLGKGLDPDRAAPLARATAASGAWNVPTQSLFETTAGEMPVAELMARPGMQYLSRGLAARWRQAVEDIRAQYPPADRQQFLRARRTLILELQRTGAGLLLGSDAPQIMNVPGFSTHQELAYLAEAGLSPLQALQSGTLRVAEFFGAPDQGRVAVGSVADLILLAANPLEDIRNSTRIIGVMRAGHWHGRAALDRLLAAIESRGL